MIGEEEKFVDASEDENELMLETIKSLTFLQLKVGDRALRNVRSLLRKPTAWKILKFFLDNKAASSYMLRNQFDMSQRSIYRSLNFLIDIGLVVKTRPIKTGEHRPFTIYGLIGYTPADVKDAFERDRRLRTPAYREVERVSQILLDNWLPPGGGKVDARELDRVIKKESRGVLWYDIKKEVYRNVSQAGYTISFPDRSTGGQLYD